MQVCNLHLNIAIFLPLSLPPLVICNHFSLPFVPLLLNYLSSAAIVQWPKTFENNFKKKKKEWRQEKIRKKNVQLYNNHKCNCCAAWNKQTNKSEEKKLRATASKRKKVKGWTNFYLFVYEPGRSATCWVNVVVDCFVAMWPTDRLDDGQNRLVSAEW